MNSAAPEVRQDSLRRLIEKHSAKEWREPLIAVHGSGAAAEIDAGGRKFAVVPTSCEMDLREKLPNGKLPEGLGRVFLIPWGAGELPPDIQGRFKGRRIHEIAARDRLPELFGAKQVTDDAASSALGKLLLAGKLEPFKPGRYLVLNRELAYLRYAGERLGLGEDFETLTDDRLVAWTLTAGVPDREVLGSLLGEMEEVLRSRFREIAALALRIRVAGRGEDFIKTLILLDAVFGNGTPPDPAVRDLLGLFLESRCPERERVLLWAASYSFGQGLVESLDKDLRDRMVIRLQADLDRADLPAKLRDAFSKSRWLRIGITAREARLAAALDRPDHDELRDAWKDFESHRQTPFASREMAAMAVRLASWLKDHPHGPEIGGDLFSDVRRLASWYAREGGFVDLARRQLRGQGGEVLGAAINRLLAAVDAIRDRLDSRFADALLSWVEAGASAGSVLPIHDVLKQIAVPFLAGNPERKLLVLLLDGMSWADAAELFPSLADDVEQWAPLSWRPAGDFGPLPAGSLPPVLAALPTITSVSRSAFFGGRPVAPGKDHPSGNDPVRFAENPCWRGALEGSKPPKLLLQPDAIGPEGLKEEAARLIDGSDRIVGIVINTIDENLQGSPTLFTRMTACDIKPLSAVLERAAGADRAVLIASDHGHIRGDRAATAPSGPQKRGSRWRPKGREAEIQACERELPERSWHPPGAERCIVLTGERNVYGAAGGAGEHGGISLAEVVAPAALFGPARLIHAIATERGEDADLRQVGFPKPPWWDLGRVIWRRPAPSLKKPPKTAEVEVAPRTPSDSSLVMALRQAEAWKRQAKSLKGGEPELFLRLLSALDAAGGRLGEAEFGACAQEPAFRIAGLVSRMTQIVNLEGYSVLAFDPRIRQVVLDRELMRELYEIAP